MIFGMLSTTNDSSYNHLVPNISASRDVQRNCNVIVTPLLGFGDSSSPPQTLLQSTSRLYLFINYNDLDFSATVYPTDTFTVMSGRNRGSRGRQAS